jgi:hypothetical protein
MKNALLLSLLFLYGISVHGVEKTAPAYEALLEEYLAHELDDVSIAHELATMIAEHLLVWKAPTIAPAQITAIIAYAFGNRILPNGNRLAGPVNEALADLVVQLYEQTQVSVYAQWEIAQMIGDRIPADRLIVINPTLDAVANVVYLSTVDVASTIVKSVGGAHKLGTVAVIAFSDHLYRCIQVSRAAGMDAYVPEGYTMPTAYDSLSGQPWTRNRLIYIMNDIKARLNNYCAQRIQFVVKE